MKLSVLTREVLRIKRIRRQLEKEGWEEIRLYPLPYGMNFTEARAGPCNTVWVKRVVPPPGLEPGHLAAGDFESPASTNSAKEALHYGD